MVFHPGWHKAAEQPYMAARLRGGSSALSSLHLFLTTQTGQLLLWFLAPLPQPLTRCTQGSPPAEHGSLTSLVPPKHTSCPIHATALSPEKKLNIVVTPSWPAFHFLFLQTTSHWLKGNNTSVTSTSTERGHAVANIKCNLIPGLGLQFGLLFPL